MTVYDAIVFGAGIEGSATAYSLVKKGFKTLLLEQFALPHTRGSSGGGTRITRKVYDTEIYTKMMLEAFEMWEAIEKEAGVTLYKKDSILLLEGSPYTRMQTAKSCFDKFNLSYKLFTNKALKKEYPDLHVHDDVKGFLDPYAGRLIANKAVTCFQNLYLKCGGTLNDDEPVLEVIPGNIITVKTSKTSYRTKQLMILAGPWAAKVLKPLGLDLPLKVVRVNVCFFHEKLNLQSSKPLPITVQYIHWESLQCTKTYLYSLPSEFPGYRKVGIHDGFEVDPDNRDAQNDQSDVEKICTMVSRSMPCLESKPSVIEPCMYTCAPDENLVLDTHPAWKNIIIAAGFAGHGFKLAPIVGKIITEIAGGETPSYDLSLFTINRFLPLTKSGL